MSEPVQARGASTTIPLAEPRVFGAQTSTPRRPVGFGEEVEVISTFLYLQNHAIT